MLPIFKMFSEYSQFLCLERKEDKYYLFGIQDIAVKYSDTWLTEKINVNNRHQFTEKVEISQKMREFNKYFISLMSFLNTFSTQRQKLKNTIFKSEDTSIFEKMVENNLIEKSQSHLYEPSKNNNKNKQSQLKDNSRNRQNYYRNNSNNYSYNQGKYLYKQDNYRNKQQYLSNKYDSDTEEQQIQEKEMASELDKTIENYQELLLLLLMSNEDFQIFFKNPLVLNYKDFKELKLSFLNLKFTDRLFLNYVEPRQSSRCKQLEIIEDISKKECLTIYSNHLVVDININLSCHCSTGCSCWNGTSEAEMQIKVPDIKSSYIYLNTILKEREDLSSINTSIHINESFLNNRCRLLIKKQPIMNYTLNLENCVQISSILNNYYSYIISSDNVILFMDSYELFYEESILMMLRAVYKSKINKILLNNLSMIFTDLFMI